MSVGNITGIGVLLETSDGMYLFQERDKNIERNPGMITPFGGEIDKGEIPSECAVREIEEELELKLTSKDLHDMGIFESHFIRGTYIQMFLAKNINSVGIVLHEGKSIRKMSVEEALQNSHVTDFTKEVLSTLRN